MPIYLFSNPSNENEIIEVIMSVNDKHEYFKDGVKWDRVFTKPNASVDTKWDANNPRDFVNKTANKKGTIGDIMDKSAELSEKREKQQGIDPIKEKAYSDYSKERGGKEHPDLRKKKLAEVKKQLKAKLGKI